MKKDGYLQKKRPSKMDISEAIRKIRTGKGIRQADVADKLGIEQSNYARMEKRGDKLTVEQLQKIADALGVTIEEIIFYGKSDNAANKTTNKGLIALLKRANQAIKVLKQQLNACQEKSERLRREAERFAQAFHKLAYDQQKIISETITILKQLQETTLRQQRFSDFEFYWFLFIKELSKESVIMQAYITCRNIEMGRDFLHSLMYSFYECITSIEGIMVSDAEKWKEILYNHSNVNRIIDLAEQTKLKLDIKFEL